MSSDPYLSAVRYFVPRRMWLTIYRYGVRFVYYSITIAISTCPLSLLLCCHSLELARTPLSVPTSTWLNCGSLTAFLPIDYAAVPGRLLLHYPVPFGCLMIFFPRLGFCCGCFPSPRRSLAYIIMDLYRSYPWEGVWPIGCFTSRPFVMQPCA